MPNTPVQATGEAVPSVSDLETPIMNVQRMASILAALLDEAMPSIKEPTYLISATQVENILFAAAHTQDLLTVLFSKWEALA